MEDQITGSQTVGPTQPAGESDHHTTHSSHQSHSGAIVSSATTASRKSSVYVKNSVKPAKGQRLVMHSSIIII